MAKKHLRLIASSVVAAAAIFAVASASSFASGSAPKPGTTVKISVPAPLTGGRPVILSVVVPKAGTKIGVDSAAHADPGQAAMDTANERIFALAGVKTVFADANLDASTQLQIADSMLSQGVKAEIQDIIFPHSLDAFLTRAKAAKVGVCVEFSPTAGGAQENDAQAGRSMVAFLHKQFPSGAQGAELGNTPAAVILNRETAFYRALAAQPDLVVGPRVRNLKEDIADARTLAENLLTANPGLQFIWTTNDNEAIGAGLAAQSLGRKIVILGMNGAPDAVAAVKAGLITATWDSNQNLIGAYVAANCVNYVTTGKFKPAEYVPFTEITKANASKWVPWPKRPLLTVVAK